MSAAPVRVPHMPDTPSRVGATDRDLVDTRNFVASDGALRYAPHLLIRKRFTGDRNSVFTGRDFDELHSERAGLVRADARLLSNSPGARNANPRRGRLIAPDDIEQVDALDDPLHGPLDGPFSVRRPDDWPGSTVRIATHRPDGYEAWIDTHSFSRHDDGPYGFAKPLPGGNRQAGDPPGNGAIHHDVCGAMSALLGADRKLRCCQPDRQWPVLPGTDSLAERRYAACRPACHPAPRRTFRGEHK
ncbi:hypothetical protein [Paraburkholderia solisilvae]|uniref:hypothetical protein n=1 Tax=Paraburkholderia solisilvae TaxID=624376 RepID=UPI0015843F75|nr:hypothetical protein [Paraburkholderia solisilvae]